MSITRECQQCGKEFETYQSEIDRGNGKFCSISCGRKYQIAQKEKEARNNSLKWSEKLSYLSGLITSDGCLDKGRPRVRFFSTDKELVEQVKEIANSELSINDCKINKKSRKEHLNLWSYNFTSRRFYYFLEDMGLMPNKSNKMKALNVPQDMFFSWLRGEIDGDGCWPIYKDKHLYLRIASGSKKLLKWVSSELTDRKVVQGTGNVNHIDHSRCHELRYAHKDSKKVAKRVYQNANYYLKRKYSTVKEFIDPINKS